MGINATLLGQMITFLILVLITMKFIWPPLIKTLRDRREQISMGLAASEKAHHELELAKKKSKELILEAKSQAAVIIEQANLRAHQIEESSREEARKIAERIKIQADSEIEKSRIEARQNLMKELVSFITAGTEKLIHRNITISDNDALLAELSADLTHKKNALG